MRLTISTPRFVLRPPEPSDAAAFARAAGDFDVAKMTSSIPQPYPVECADGWILIQRARMHAGLGYVFAIEAWGDDGLSLGSIGCASVFRRTPSADWEVGYHVAKPYWGRGVASEVVAALIDWAQDEIDPPRLVAGCFADNPASARVLAKAGFRPTGSRRPVYSIARGENTTCLDFELDLETGQETGREGGSDQAEAAA